MVAGAAALVVAAICHAESHVTIQPGDTLFGLARRHLGDASRWTEIAELNRLAPPYLLVVGDSLLLPVARAVAPVATVTTIASDPSIETAPVPFAADTARAILVATARPAFVPETVEPLAPLLEALAAHNPSIRAAEEIARAASYRPSQAGALPDPMLRAAVRYDPQREVMVSGGMASVQEKTMVMPMLQLSQMIPLGKLGPMSEYERAMARASLEMVGVERASRAGFLKAAYAELHGVDRAAVAEWRIRETLELLVRSAEALYRAGLAQQSDLLRAHLELSMVADRLLMIEARRRALAARINGLLDRPETTPVGTPMALRSYAIAVAPPLENAPEVAAARAEVESARAGVGVARSMFIPDLELMGGAMFRSNLDPQFEVGVGVSLPIWGAAKQTPGLREAEARLRAAEARLRAVRAETRERVEVALAMAGAAAAQAELHRTTIIPQARLTLDASFAGYRAGRIDFMAVIGNVTTLLNYEIARDRADADFYRAVAMIEELSGAPLPWNGAPVEGEAAP
jgi:outer membrane protein TolC